MKSKVIYESVGTSRKSGRGLRTHTFSMISRSTFAISPFGHENAHGAAARGAESAKHGLLCAIAPSARIEDSAACGLPPGSDLANLSPDVYRTIVVCYELVKFVRDTANAILAEERPR
jgi:hypothetical protein